MKKIFTAETLKFIAVIAMTIDHTAFIFINNNSPIYFLMRMIGRLTAPIMTYFIVEGFIHTSSRKKYFLRIFIFAVLSQPFYFIMLKDRVPKDLYEFLTHLNVMFTLCLSLLVLEILSSKKLHMTIKLLLIGVCFMAADICDWTYIIPAWAIIFFLFRNDKRKRTLLFIGTSVVLLVQRYLPQYESFADFSYQLGVILALIPLNFYNGKRSKSNSILKKKINLWFFYIYYPLHIAVLYIISIK